MRALVTASENVPKHRSKALLSLYMYLPAGTALTDSTEVNKIKLKSAKNLKVAMAVLLFSFIDVTLQLSEKSRQHDNNSKEHLFKF